MGVEKVKAIFFHMIESTVGIKMGSGTVTSLILQKFRVIMLVITFPQVIQVFIAQERHYYGVHA